MTHSSHSHRRGPSGGDGGGLTAGGVIFGGSTPGGPLSVGRGSGERGRVSGRTAGFSPTGPKVGMVAVSVCPLVSFCFVLFFWGGFDCFFCFPFRAPPPPPPFLSIVQVCSVVEVARAGGEVGRGGDGVGD